MYKSIPNRSLFAIFFGIVAVLLPFTVVAASKPVGYWKFDDSISDLVTDDSSANTSNGTVGPGLSLEQGSKCILSNCIAFDNLPVNTDYVSVPDSPVLNFNATASFSISVWVKGAFTDDGPHVIIAKPDQTLGKGYSIFVPGDGSKKIAVNLNDGSHSTQPKLDRVINDTKWHHLVIVIDRVQNQKMLRGYIDGNLQKWTDGSQAVPIDSIGDLTNNSPFKIGANVLNQTPWLGSIDELQLFNTVLTQADVTALYQEGATGVGASCSSNTDCTDKPGGSKNLECRGASQGKKCVPTPANRKIGTWCDAAEHCNTQEGILKLTCNSEKNMCVGASSGISCAEEEVNTDPLLGKINQDIEPADRCDRNSLFCNTNFICQADLGATSASQIAGVGRGTEDIRDTIRNIINIALGFLGVIGVLLVLYGGWIWMTAMGEEEKVEKAKKTIIAGVVGMAIIAVAWTIVSFVLSAAQNVSGG